MTVKRRDITVEVYRSFAEANEAAQGWWKHALSPPQRVAFAWRLSHDLWRMIGRLPGESGLPRFTAVLHRR